MNEAEAGRYTNRTPKTADAPSLMAGNSRKNQRFGNSSEFIFARGFRVDRSAMADAHRFELIFVALVAGIVLEHWRARLARYIWRTKKGGRRQDFRGRVLPFQKSRPLLATDPAEQLRIVTGAHFEKRRLLSKSEAHVFYTAERAVKDANLP